MVVGLAWPRAAFSSFNLDYVVTGRIWLPILEIERDGLPSTNLVVAISDFKDCPATPSELETWWQPPDRDCRFEQQLAEALATSGMFVRVLQAAAERSQADIVLVPRHTRVRFTRSVIPATKPLVVLTFFSYLWTPLPYEVDVESYDFDVAILSPSGEMLSEVAWAGEFRHVLGSYSADRNLPADLANHLEVDAKASPSKSVCQGPHAGEAIHQFFLKLGAAVAAVGR